MDKTIIEYNIPIQDRAMCDRHNVMLKEAHGDKFTTPVKPTEDHVILLFKRINEVIEKVGDKGGWYVGDGIKVKVEIEYDPENK